MPSVLLLAAVLLVFAILPFLKSREEEKRLGAGVKRYPGTKVRTRTPFRERRIDLPGPPCAARVRWWIHDEVKRYTEFVADLPYARRKLRIATLGWASGGKLVGSRLETGDAAFDAAYDIATTYADWATPFLDEETRGQIRKLDGLHSGPFLLDLRGTQLVVRVHGEVEEAEDIDAFIAGCYALCSRALGRIEGAEIGMLQNEGRGGCPVCGTPVGDVRVICRECRTPHHGDCWTYNGGCAIFACGGRRTARD
jgi:hypothetical protein